MIKAKKDWEWAEKKAFKLNRDSRRKIKKFAKELVPLYELFNWKWIGNLDRTPNAEEIEQTIIELVNSLFEEEDTYYVATGGLEVSRDEKNHITIKWAIKKIYL